jgi:hypothetical protein
VLGGLILIPGIHEADENVKSSSRQCGSRVEEAAQGRGNITWADIFVAFVVGIARFDIFAIFVIIGQVDVLASFTVG